jgi:hypothetical protein
MTQKLIIAPDGTEQYLDLTPEEEAEKALSDQEAAEEQVVVAAEIARQESINSDPGYVDLVNKLKTMTPAQWADYLTNNMTTLAQARIVIYRMGLALMAMARSLP